MATKGNCKKIKKQKRKRKNPENEKGYAKRKWKRLQ